MSYLLFGFSIGEAGRPNFCTGFAYFDAIFKRMTERSDIQVGNAATDAQKGWFIGSFMDEKFGLRHSEDVELKWGVHPAGEERPEWVTSEARTAVSILISGKFEIMFRDRTVTMSQLGDFVMWGEGDDHKWRALEDAVVLTVRWPSIRQY
jgi:hypothetical protein